MIPLSTYEAAEKRLHALGDGARPTTAEAKAVRVLAQGPKRKPSKKQRRDRLGAATLHHEEVRKASKDERRERVGVIREAVFARAGGQCEAWIPLGIGDVGWAGRRRCAHPPEAMDHWLGGSGRRRALESEETCWALCREHNRGRTMNSPSTAWWNETFRLHCDVHGYAFTPHYDARAASRPGAEGERDPKENER